jgi:predicted DNA-binding transcriptional regulator AlpA
MPARSPTESSLPAVVSVTEMARRLGLSRSRFYELVASGIFPMPVYCIHSRRPMYLSAQIVECLRVKQTNIGCNGRYCLFYAARQSSEQPRQTRASRPEALSAHAEILDGLRVLGLADVTDQQVGSALQICFPNGWAGRDEGEVLRAVWTYIRRSNVA